MTNGRTRGFYDHYRANNASIARSGRVSSRRVSRLPAELQHMVRNYYVRGLRYRLGYRQMREASARQNTMRARRRT